MSVSRRALPFAVAALFALGCQSKPDAPSSAPPPSGLPPLGEEPKAAPPSDHPVHAPMGDPLAGAPSGMPAMPPGHPAIDPAQAEAEAATPGDIPFDPKAVVNGVLRLDDKVKAKVAEGDVIFLVARGADPSGQPGPVLAVKRMTAGKWPLVFTLDARDAMVSGTKLHGKVVVSARVDKDGDAISKNPGDVTGASRPVDVPAQKVVITLDTVL
jgi:hypothetical protein